MRFSDVVVDLAAHLIHRGETEIHLTPIEFRLLAVLLNNAGKVLTQRQLLNQVWGPNAVEHSHYLRIYMGHFATETGARSRAPPPLYYRNRHWLSFYAVNGYSLFLNNS